MKTAVLLLLLAAALGCSHSEDATSPAQASKPAAVAPSSEGSTTPRTGAAHPIKKIGTGASATAAAASAQAGDHVKPKTGG